MIDKIDFQPTRPIRKTELMERIASAGYRHCAKWLDGRLGFQTVPDTGFYFRTKFDPLNENGIVTQVYSKPFSTWNVGGVSTSKKNVSGRR